MEACVRGFSFMPENKVDVLDLQYIKSDELERTWKATRRQKIKEQEQKIWNEFVKEQDIVKSVVTDDPYQFLVELPESCLKELMDDELNRMKMEKEAEVEAERQKQVVPAIQEPVLETLDVPHTVTFADETEVDKEDNTMFKIFDDDDTGPDGEDLNGSLSPTSPNTVREREEDYTTSPVRASVSPDKESAQSSDNMSNVIESSIYCAKVKEMRYKICDEMMSIIDALDLQNIVNMDPQEIKKRVKRSSEFCARFNRIYMYQLKRQIHDINRHNLQSLPFAKHTQFQSQMVRIVSLHQNMLQSFQVFHKSFEQTSCLKESMETLSAMLGTFREAGVVCAAAAAPRDFSAAQDLYVDEAATACDKLETALEEFREKVNNFLNDTATGVGSKTKVKQMKSNSMKFIAKSGTEPNNRLSMYSFDGKSNKTSSKGSIRKLKRTGTATASPKKEEQDKKSPRSRLPLMRGALAGSRPRRPAVRDADVTTLVETLDLQCNSSIVSRETSPTVESPRKGNTPRNQNITPRKTLNTSPQNPKNKIDSPRSKIVKSSTVKHVKSPDDFKKSVCDIKVNVKKMNEISLDKEKEIKMNPVELKKGNVKKSDDKGENKGKSHENKVPATKEQSIKENHSKHRNTTNESDPAREMGSKHINGPSTPKQDSARKAGNFEDQRSEANKNESSKSRGKQEEIEQRKEVDSEPVACDVTKLLRSLCGGDGKGERVSGAKNAQLICVSGNNSPRQPSTPQLLRILEETIKKKTPKCTLNATPSPRDEARHRMLFHLPDSVTDSLFHYRTKFVQHMLSSSLYANSAIGKPWEMIDSVSDQLIDELLLGCTKEMELKESIRELYRCETR